MWVWTIMLIPLLLPGVAGVALALIFRRPRTDILALLASALVLLGYQLLCLKFNRSFSAQSVLVPMGATTVTLVAATSASVSMGLFIPYILARWGAETVDYIRRRHLPVLRRGSSGNAVLSTIFGVIFVSMLAQSLPVLIATAVPSFFEARHEALQRHASESVTNEIATHGTVRRTAGRHPDEFGLINRPKADKIVHDRDTSASVEGGP